MSSHPVTLQQTGRMQRFIGLTRYLVILGIITLTILSIATFVWAGAKTTLLVSDLLDGGWRNEYYLVKLLQVIDTVLLAVVQLIVALGLYELFVDDLDLPEWLTVHSLDELKKPVVDGLVVFVSIKGIEVLFNGESSADALRTVTAVGILVLALTAFRFKPGKGAGPKHLS